MILPFTASFWNCQGYGHLRFNSTLREYRRDVSPDLVAHSKPVLVAIRLIWLCRNSTLNLRSALKQQDLQVAFGFYELRVLKLKFFEYIVSMYICVLSVLLGGSLFMFCYL